MRKSDRLFQVVNLIRAHQPITANKLADRLNVSVRTIYRYIDDLSVSGIPIYGEPGVGYAMHKNFELRPLTLKAIEIDILTLALDMLSTSVGGTTKATAQALLAKIEAASPLGQNVSDEKRFFSMVETPAISQSKCWEALQIAIKSKTAIQIEYLSIQNQKSTRNVFPLGIFYWGGKWTVGTWCYAREAYRDFRIDRILDVHDVSDLAYRDDKANLTDYMKHQSVAWKEVLSRPTDSTLSVDS